MGMIIGGGRGIKDKDVFVPLMKALEGPLYAGVPMAGTCLWFQKFSQMISRKEFGQEGRWRLTARRLGR